MKLIKSNSSPNHFNGRNGWKPDIIVFHQTGGTELAPAMRWYLMPNAQCSPNWLIDTNGDIYQLVDPDNGAWCNGTSTNTGDNKYYGYALSEIVRLRKTNCNYYSYSAEFVHCARGEITEAQRTAAVELIQQVIIPHMKKNGVTPQIDRKHIIGHSEVTPKTRDPEKFNCPGKLFPFDEIIARVNDNNTSGNMPTVKTTPVKYIYQAISTAAIRADTSKSAQLYGRVTKWKFYTADALNSDGSWFKHAEQNAWSKLEDGGSLFSKVGDYVIKTTTTKVNIRSSPGVSSNKVATLDKGAKVYVWCCEPVKMGEYSWYKIIYNNSVAYIASEYVR